MIAHALSIAGSDPSGGAGIQADLKTFSARGVYGMAVLTALTAQNTRGVTGVHAVPAGFVADQLRAVLADVRVDAVKIGMIANAGIAAAIADVLEDEWNAPLVLDPVMVAKGGAPLLDPDAVDAVTTRLLPLATVLTPNLPEAAKLLGAPPASTRQEMEEQAHALTGSGPRFVLLKGGHLSSDDSPDVLVGPEGSRWFEGPRVATRNTHGTGCTLSSAIAAGLACGLSVENAVEQAKGYLATAIAAADALDVGSGHGPVHHFAGIWDRSE